MRRRIQNAAAVLSACAAALLLASLASAQTPGRGSGARAMPSPQPVAGAQTSETRSEAQTPAAGDDGNADLSITAHVTAKSLRFEKVPNPKVEFTGSPRRETVWDSQRENLPQEVRPGVTYRNIGITLRITSVFADIDRIVAEALGEIPPSDDAQPQPAAPERPASPPDSQKNPDGGAQVLDDKSADDASAAPANAAANSPNAGAAPQQPAPQTPPPVTSPARASTPHRRVPARRGRNK